jgi:acyl phosphate:glycerol-3-phosphate acyltransferase
MKQFFERLLRFARNDVLSDHCFAYPMCSQRQYFGVELKMILPIFLFLLAYVTGSLSSAIIVCKVMGLPDPRKEGSKNPGATNVLRLGGKKAAVITLLGDVLKGVVPILIARFLGVEGFFLGLIGLGAFLGHLFPIFFKFQGGKGVATSLGVVLAVSPLIGLLVVITWVLIAAIFKYSSLAALVSALLAPFYFLILNQKELFLPFLLIALILIARHYENIKRLISGTETKIKLK